jgi:hypothetical protein
MIKTRKEAKVLLRKKMKKKLQKREENNKFKKLNSQLLRKYR